MAVLPSRALPLAFTILAACGSQSGEDAGPSTVTHGEIPMDAVFIVNGGDATLSVVDQSTDGVVGTIELRGVQYPHHIDLDQAGARMLLGVPGRDLSAGHGGHGSNMDVPMGMVLMLDAHTGELLDFHRLEGSNHNAIFAVGDSEVWTSEWNGTEGAVVVLAADDLQPVARIGVGSMPAEVTLGPDGSRAFVCNGGSGTVSVIDVAGKTVTAEIPVGDTPVGAWPGRDGLMYVDNEASKTISVIDPAALVVTRTFDLGFTPAMAVIAPSGELWITDTDAGRVVAFDPDSDDALPVREIAVGAGAHAIAFSTDETRAYVTNQNADTLSVIDVVAGTVLDTLVVGHQPNGLVARGG